MSIRQESFTVSGDEFASKRKGILETYDDALYSHVADAMKRIGLRSWENPLIDMASKLFKELALTEADEWTPVMDDLRDEFARELRETLQKAKPVGADQFLAQVERTTKWMSTMIVNAATEAATTADPDENVGLEWVTMQDGSVRESHKEAHGQQVPTGEKFEVGGVKLLYPGEPVGDPENWINCRCVVRPAMLSGMFATQTGGVDETAESVDGVTILTAAAKEDVVPTDQVEDEVLDDEAPMIPDDQADVLVPWHGVLAPEGIPSGDGRMFAAGGVTWRDLPLTLKAMFVDDEGHKGSVVAGRIDKIWREDGLIKAEGVFDSSPGGYESIRMLAEKMWRGVSVDVDAAELAVEEYEEDGTRNLTFSKARISAATLCVMPAFAEAYVALGPWPAKEAEVPDVREKEEAAVSRETFISEEKWDGSASRFTPEQWKASCILHTCDGEEKSCHHLPIKEPGGALSRAGVHAAAGRLNQVDASAEQKAAAKAALRGAYKQLGEEPPESLKAAVEGESFRPVPPQTKDGPGWITHPDPTEDITNYWVDGRGAAKIRWGAGGDFNRCRRQLAKYVQNPDWLAGLCANLHYRALGIWPGEHKGEASGGTEQMAGQADPNAELPSVTLTASAAVKQKVSADFFRNPMLDGPTALVVDEETGHVYGHAATWDTCHIGKVPCVTPPHSALDYAYFLHGEFETDAGPVPVGQITLGTGHADPNLGIIGAMAHYDNTGAAVADVYCGEDDYGIWVSGLLREGITPKQIRELRAAGVSGDWRGIVVGGQENLEMCAVLAVNVPGFPIPRVRVAMSGERQLSLVAAGMLEPREVDESDPDRIARIAALQATARSFRAARIKASIHREGR